MIRAAALLDSAVGSDTDKVSLAISILEQDNASSTGVHGSHSVIQSTSGDGVLASFIVRIEVERASSEVGVLKENNSESVDGPDDE